ncbi:MAG: hypothetical protein WKG07_49310 [Hymenobacter sp.]
MRQPDGTLNGASARRTTAKRPGVRGAKPGDIIPTDGEIIEGLATIDESAITGESAPVIREAGGDKSSVTGGTKVLSDRIVVQVTTAPGESFLDKMIALVEGASRQKTPNEIALTILLAGFTLVFVIVVRHAAAVCRITPTRPSRLPRFIALFVCLIPTTIGGLLLGHRHCGHGPGPAGQRHCQERQGRGNGRRHRRAAAGQNRHHHHRQPQGHPLLARARRGEQPAWSEAAPSARSPTKRPEGKSIVELARDTPGDPADLQHRIAGRRAHQVHGRNPLARA